jgi:hypothetical protein
MAALLLRHQSPDSDVEIEIPITLLIIQSNPPFREAIIYESDINPIRYYHIIPLPERRIVLYR